MKRLKKIMVALLACLTVGVSAVGLSSCKEDEDSASYGSSSEKASSENEEPHTHIWDDGVITTEAICETDGVKTFTCTCGETYTETVPATGHDYKEEITAPTCTEQGYTMYTCACGDTYGGNVVSATGHDYTEKITAPTCTKKGYTTYTCACGDTYGGNVVSATGHDYTKETTAPTCTKPGYITYTCACGDSYLEIVKLPSHNYTVEITFPTCTEQGYATYTCACGDTYVDNVVNATGHDYAEEVTAPTCTEQGYTTYTCACGDTYVGNYVKANGHDYAEEVTAPTCTEQGYTTYTCACGDTYVDNEVEATGHDYAEEVTAPTCTEQGYTTYTCACGDAYVGNYVKAGHTEVIDEAVAPTCTATGLTEGKHCSACGATLLAQESVEMIAHNYVKGVCDACDDLQTKGLQYSKLYNSYSVKGIGTCTDTSIVIPSKYKGLPVTKIGSYAFEGCSSLTSVEIPDSVTSIESGAFVGCSNLTSVEIPDSVTSIEYGAFEGCSSLTSVVIPDSVTSIGSRAFYGTAYYNDESNWENGVLYIGKYLIEAKTSIAGDYTIKDGTLCIAKYVFYGCSSLTSIEIPDSVTSIGSYVFSNCDNLISITVGENNTAYQSIDGNLYTKDDVTLVRYAGGKTDASFVIPDGVVEIGEYAFYKCKNLTSVVIPDDVTKIYYNTFYDCYNLTNVTIGGGLTEIDTGYYSNVSPFWYLDNLTNITVSEKNTTYQSIDGNLYTKDGTTLLQYAIGKTDKTFIVPDGVTTIGKGAFAGCNSLTSVVIGDSVNAFCCGAFQYVPLENVYFEEEAFANFIDSLDYSGASELFWGYNDMLLCARWYCYSEEERTVVGLWWHYVDGVPTSW